VELTIDREDLVRRLVELLQIPSPTGRADAAVDYMERAFADLGVETRRTRKGALLAVLPGQDPTAPARALAAHVDTLGAMVKEIKPSGRLKLTRIGSYPWFTVVGEYCTVHTLDGRQYTGTVVPVRASVHVHGPEMKEIKWEDDDVEVRLDERVSDPEGVRALGIGVGDFVSWDPRTVVTPAGFIKSRHLDNKAAAAVFLAAARVLRETGRQPTATTYLFISNYEEVGHGAAAGIPPEVAEIVAVDMAAVGRGQTSDEFSCTICVMDSDGPYDYALSRRLIQLARAHGIPHQVDIYPYYGSDAGAALQAGLEARHALMGPGVDASHSYERTHVEALEATARLVLAYVLS